jgi:hypothetical protein
MESKTMWNAIMVFTLVTTQPRLTSEEVVFETQAAGPQAVSIEHAGSSAARRAPTSDDN